MKKLLVIALLLVGAWLAYSHRTVILEKKWTLSVVVPDGHELVVEGFKDRESCEYYFDQHFPENLEHLCA